jgi:hypothetical protein
VAIPWWVYLIGVVTVLFGVALHLLPSYLAKLEAQDKRRREELRTRNTEATDPAPD